MKSITRILATLFGCILIVPATLIVWLGDDSEDPHRPDDFPHILPPHEKLRRNH